MTQFLKNILVIFTIILMTANGTNAQSPVADPQLVLAPSNPYTKIDHSTMRCQYRQTIVNDPRNPEKSTRENIMLLQIGKDVSRYSDIKKIMGDSLMLALEKQGADNNTIIRKLLPLERGRSSEVILKNYPNGKITFTNYLMASYLYEEVYKSPNWKLGQDTTTILGYPCRLATTNFRGRNYRAWFAPDIPVDDGPWKLRGLPGLILKATDDKNEVSFECISIEKVSWQDDIYLSNPNLGYIRTSKSAYEKLVRDFQENPAGYIQPVLQTELPASAKRKRAYNPIELSE